MNFFLFFFQNDLCQFCFVIVFFKTLWIVTIFIHMVFVLLQCFPICFFLKIIFVEFFFNIELVENYNCRFPHMFFSKNFFFFFFYFFNMELVENLALYFFSLKHCELLQCFPTWFFFSFFIFFPELSMLILFFFILSWLII